MVASALQQAIHTHTPLGEAVCLYIRTLAKGLGANLTNEPDWQKTTFNEKTDPYSGEISLVGTWKNGNRYGTATFFPDGRVFAEYQLLVNHPEKPRKFVESVSVWGHLGALKQEANLLDLPE